MMMMMMMMMMMVIGGRLSRYLPSRYLPTLNPWLSQGFRVGDWGAVWDIPGQSGKTWPLPSRRVRASDNSFNVETCTFWQTKIATSVPVVHYTGCNRGDYLLKRIPEFLPPPRIVAGALCFRVVRPSVRRPLNIFFVTRCLCT